MTTTTTTATPLLFQIPFIRSLAYLIWGGGDDEKMMSPELCIQQLPFMMQSCWTRLIVKGMGVAIILGAFFNKAPMIVNLLESESAEGVSRLSLYAEWFALANAFAYGMLEHYPLTAYGENGALLLQCTVIIALLWRFNPRGVHLLERIGMITLALTYTYLIHYYLPGRYHYVLPTMNYPIQIYARGLQIWTAHQCQHTGAHSIITTFLNVMGSIIRILTTVQEMGWDWPVLCSFGLSALLNGICFIQHWWYWDNTLRFLASLEESKQGGVEAPKATVPSSRTKKTLPKRKEE